MPAKTLTVQQRKSIFHALVEVQDSHSFTEAEGVYRVRCSMSCRPGLQIRPLLLTISFRFRDVWST